MQVDEVALDVLLESFDPFLSETYHTFTVLQQPSRTTWHRLIEGAWRILVDQHRTTAEAFAAGVTTLVPLREPAPGRPVSATSGHAWGAIAMSLPPDPRSGAETLVHEFQHLVLGAVEDIAPLVGGREESLYYAPWRDDPRPLTALIHGSYAFFGVTAFWRQQRYQGAVADRLCGEAEFARRRRDVLDAARQVAGASQLTENGTVLTHGMLRQLALWKRESVPAEAEAIAAEMSAEHKLRWRLAHLSPNQDATDAMARAWLAGLRESPHVSELTVTLTPSTYQLTQDLAWLLHLRIRDPEKLDQLLRGPVTEIGAAHAAFIQGDNATAWCRYLQCVASGNKDAWIGLLLVHRRRSGTEAGSWLADRPEVVAALYERACLLTGAVADAEALIQWLEAGPRSGPGEAE